MQYRTNKCNHGQRARCINCLAKQLRTQKKIQQQSGSPDLTKKCVHPANMKCLKCITTSAIKNQGKACQHSGYQRCANCRRQQNYETFEYYVEKLANDCKHRKPCKKCVPVQARRTFGIDLECRNHAPFPQAQCDACMAPTITVQKQPYSHVHKVVIKTMSVHRIIDANLFGILLGSEKNGVVYVEDIFFPQEQVSKGQYLSPQVLLRYGQIFASVGYSQVGLIYSSSEITAMSLMLSSSFQEQSLSVDKNGFQISKFITMRLHWDESNPYFECFMVSDQFQAFHRHNLVFQKSNGKDHFDLITAKEDKNNKFKSLPTFLRRGVETQEVYFQEIIVWIQTISEQNFFVESANLTYPFFTLQQQRIEDMEVFTQTPALDPLQKYRNIQFILHMLKLFGRERALIFLNCFLYQDPELFLEENIAEARRRQKFNEKMLQENYADYLN